MKTIYKDHTAFLIQKCPMCGTECEMPLTETQEQNLALIGQKLIQELYSELNSCEREFIKSGYCPKCQEMLFGNGETKLINEKGNENE